MCKGYYDVHSLCECEVRKDNDRKNLELHTCEYGWRMNNGGRHPMKVGCLDPHGSGKVMRKKRKVKPPLCEECMEKCIEKIKEHNKEEKGMLEDWIEELEKKMEKQERKYELKMEKLDGEFWNTDDVSGEFYDEECKLDREKMKWDERWRWLDEETALRHEIDYYHGKLYKEEIEGDFRLADFRQHPEEYAAELLYEGWPHGF